MAELLDFKKIISKCPKKSNTIMKTTYKSSLQSLQCL